MKRGKTVLWAAALTLLFGPAHGQRVMEKINRGLVAVPSGGGYFLSWRLWGTEPENTAFNVYKGSAKLNATPITAATLYQDNSAGSGAYTVKPVLNGVEQAASEVARALSGNYLTVPLQIPPAGTANGSSYNYTSANPGMEGSIGDLDGDGEYEIVLKWDPSNARDNASSGYTGPCYLDAYKLSGTRLWRINMGPNIRAGQHYTQFLVYDFDGDGRAELISKTGDGTVDGTGAIIGDAAARWTNSNGYIITGPEYLTVFDGLSGKALKTVNYVPERGNVGSWGGVGGNGGNDTYGNRVDRFLAAVAYLDGTRPSAVFCRGYYGKSVLAAWDWRNGQLSQRWVFNSAAWDSIQPAGSKLFSGQGSHTVAVADVDGDGKDEIVYGSMTVDDNGTGLYSTGFRHGDALHVGDLDPARPGLEVFMTHENEGSANSSPGMELHSARTGQVYWSTAVGEDVSKGMAADVDSTRPGCEFWGGEDIVNAVGVVRSAIAGAATGGPNAASTNFAVWWDGDLLRELEDDISITKYGGGNLLTASGCTANNFNKGVPVLSADLFGDWREEVVWKTSDNSALRIYISTATTSHRFYTLLHNPQYRLSVAWQNVAYSHPPHVDYYLGVGMTAPARPDIVTPGGSSRVSGGFRSASPGSAGSYRLFAFLGENASLAGRGPRTEGTPIYAISGKKLRWMSPEKDFVSLRKQDVSAGIYLLRTKN